MAYKRRILTDPNPVLHKATKKMGALELKLPLTQQLIDDMIVTMYDAPGIGLAAPQVGAGKRIFVCDVGEEHELYVFVNPVLSDVAGEETSVEGCLSIPGKVGDLTRAQSCVLSGLDRHGKKIRVEASGLLARCFQHEVDHLDGILISDKAEMRDALPPDAAEDGQVQTAAKEVSI
ncbi:MAG TPA: peptide deformylase [Candidatus Eremiobacteraceae bacterium]|nr:peptide deformylase [Candidatus Eremiobacteraceae bacterium]